MPLDSQTTQAVAKRSGSKQSSAVMEPLCKDFQSGNLKHSEINDVRRQLMAEGYKRTEAMLFEELFQRLVIRAFKNDIGKISFGWVGAFAYGSLSYWFRLETDSDLWNVCDDAIAKKLQSKKWIKNRKDGSGEFTVSTDVYRVRLCPNKGLFVFSKRGEDGKFWNEVDENALRKILKRDGKDVSKIQDSSGSNSGRQERAIRCLEYLRDSNLKDLSIRRRFMNCLIPGFGWSPIDLDVVHLAEDGQIRYIEFKRKYPAAGQEKFGLDEAHVSVMNLMKDVGVASLHILLVSPVWTANADPVLWYLDVPNFEHKWAWVAATLDEKFIGHDTSMQTEGGDSGHHGGARVQHAIEWDGCRLLSQGLGMSESALISLRDFLASASMEKLPKIGYDGLRRLTDQCQ
ncbi:hypothetical protein [Ferrigenium kumadai]|nr:hypothetical protein [Ferrigenium kumadai]